MEALKAISPIDGRYINQVGSLSSYFSEYALIKYRVQVEVEYFIALCELPLPSLQNFPSEMFAKLRTLYTDFSLSEAEQIKQIEKTTNHDVKAVEYYIKEKFTMWGIQTFKEFVHFGLTSQDINNTAIPISFREFLNTEYYPLLHQTVDLIDQQAKRWAHIPMLSRTHGQPASPTRFGKELAVFVERINRQIRLLKSIPHGGKMGGATGNLNAHAVAFPDIDWHGFVNRFLQKKLHLTRSHPTTQIDHYDYLAAQLDGTKRINTIWIDYCRDMWQYISADYLRQKVNQNEVGSSAMPHKINPIDFENAEGNLSLANTLLEFMSSKLPISRLQRDLTDSTVIRNLGLPLGYSCIALRAIQRGTQKLNINQSAVQYDLDKNWMVIAEAVQTILRREGYPQPYETIKQLTRSYDRITKQEWHIIIDRMKISDAVKEELKQITPYNYVGI